MLDVIKEIALNAIENSGPVNVLFGTVTSVSPLKINVEQRFELTEDFLILTSNVKDHQTKMSFDNPGIKNIVLNYSMDDSPGSNYKLAFQAPIQNDITVYNGLKIGESVMLIRVQGGQKYIVLDRVV